MSEGLRLTIDEKRHATREQVRLSILDAIGAEPPEERAGTIHNLENIVLRVVGTQARVAPRRHLESAETAK